MFVHRIAGPSRLSMPAKLAPPRPRKTRSLTVEGSGCFVLVQRHKSRMSQQPNLGTQDPLDRRKKKELGDPEAIKKQGKQIAKMGKRGQERKPIDASVFPTLDVELIEEHKYPRQLYFPYMPRKLRDWPIFAGFSLENVIFAFLAVFKRKFWRRVLLAVPAMPKRTLRAINKARIATNEALALPPPAFDASPENQKTRSPSSVPSIIAPRAAQQSSELEGPSLKMVSQAITAPDETPLQATPAANESNSLTDSPGITIVGNTSASISDTSHPATSRASRRPSIFSKHYWQVFFILVLERHAPKLARNTYMFFKPGYLAVRGFMQKYWDWRYLDPGHWSPQRRREARIGIKRFRLDLWRDAVKYIQESEKYGKDARDYYMKKLENDRNNWGAMKLIAAHNRFPEHSFNTGLATRDPWDSRWYSSTQRKARLKEDRFFTDMSSPKSPLNHILKSIKGLYVEMNEAIAAGRIDDLNQYAAKRYLNEIERRATSVRRGRENMSQTWQFRGWVNDPKCISIRAKDFFADYPGAYQGDHLVLNLLMKFDTWQSLVTVEKPEGRHGGRRNRKVKQFVETRRVTEYIVVDFRTWIWEGKPRFIQEIYPDQKLDLVTHQITEAKMLRLLKKQAAEAESGENDAQKIDRQGKAPALNPIT